MAIHVLLVILIVHYVTGKIEEELLQLLVVQLSDVSEESSDKQSTINQQMAKTSPYFPYVSHSGQVTHRETGEVMVLKEMLNCNENTSSGFLNEVSLSQISKQYFLLDCSLR